MVAQLAGADASILAAISATSRSIVGHAIRCRAAARSTEPGIASSSAGRPAAMSRCIELPSVACAALSSAIALAGSTSSAPSARATAATLLDRAEEV